MELNSAAAFAQTWARLVRKRSRLSERLEHGAGKRKHEGWRGMYPAKYSFSPTSTANCGNASTPDFVVYNTGARERLHRRRWWPMTISIRAAQRNRFPLSIGRSIRVHCSTSVVLFRWDAVSLYADTEQRQRAAGSYDMGRQSPRDAPLPVEAQTSRAAARTSLLCGLTAWT